MPVMNQPFETLMKIGDLANSGYLIYDLDKKEIIYANDAVTQITGLSSHDGLDEIKNVFDNVIEDDREFVLSRYAQLSRPLGAVEFEFQLTDPKGDLRFVCCNCYLLAESSSIVVNISDITKPKQHEGYLVEFGTKKNTLLETLNHHISGALMLMQHLTGQAERSLESSNTDNLKVYLSLLKNNSSHCIDIINDLMNEEHLESPSIYVKKNRIDLVEKVGYIFKEIKQSFESRNISFEANDKQIFVETDEIKILQIINNLVSNALKFTPHEKPVIIRLAESDTNILISVIDEGIGIPDNIKPFIFDRQSIGGRQGLNGQKSNGMGLSISKRLCELIGATLTFVSDEGEGSAFYVQLPKW
jgi:two-component system, OmpR family, sensor histidine kinase VicK